MLQVWLCPCVHHNIDPEHTLNRLHRSMEVPHYHRAGTPPTHERQLCRVYASQIKVPKPRESLIYSTSVPQTMVLASSQREDPVPEDARHKERYANLRCNSGDLS